MAIREDLVPLWEYWQHWKGGVPPDEESEDGAKVRTFVSSTAAVLDRLSPYAEEPDDPLVTLLRRLRGELEGRVPGLCGRPRPADGRFAVYQGIRGDPAEAMRTDLAAAGQFVLAAERPWSFAPSAALARAHARRGRRRAPDARVPGLIYRAWVRADQVVFVDDVGDGFPVANLEQERELVVWVDAGHIIPALDVCELNVERAPT